MNLRVKSWNKFQHFKDRRPPWIKLYRELLDDIEWHELDAMAAKVLVMIWLIASEADGALPDSKTLAFRLRITESVLETIVSKLNHWLEQVDSAVITDRHQSDTPEREAETEGEREAKPRGARRQPGKPCPQEFDVTESMADWANALGLPDDRVMPESEKFLAHHRAKGSLFADWNSAWQNWIRKSVEFGGFKPRMHQ